MRRERVLECAAASSRPQDWSSITLRRSRGRRLMISRANNALESPRVETNEVMLLCAKFRTGHKDHARRRYDEDAVFIMAIMCVLFSTGVTCGSRHFRYDLFRWKRDDLHLQVAVVGGQVDELRRHRDEIAGCHEGAGSA